MRKSIPLLCAGIALAGIGGYYLLPIHGNNKVEQVEYPHHLGGNPHSLPLKFCAPTTNLQAVPETGSVEYFPGELLALEGSLITEPGQKLRPVLVRFMQRRWKDGKEIDVVANSGVEIPKGNLQEFKLLINVPSQPGEYEMLISWGGPTEYIAKSKVVVRPAR